MLRKLIRTDRVRFLKIATAISIFLFFISFAILPFDTSLFIQIIGVLGGIISALAALIALIPESRVSLSEHLKARASALDWQKINRVDGYFHNTLRGAIELDIEKELLLDYNNPQSRGRESDEKSIKLENPSSTKLFIENKPNFVILGEPGSGKTYFVRQILQELIKKAMGDVQKNIPLFLNLSSWSRSFADLEEWIGHEIYQQMGIRKGITDQWLRENIVHLLLDALDEVPSTDRQACVDSINNFIAKMSYPHVILTCRKREYDSLTGKANVPVVVNILPLNQTQIEQYLETSNATITTQILHNSKELLELAKVPLILRVIMLAYNHTTESELNELYTIKQKTDALFDSYISRMFQHRPLDPDEAYDKHQACNWLSSIAENLRREGRSEFFIENINERWLNNSHLKWYYTLVATVGILLILPIGAFAISTSLPIIFSLIVGSGNSERAVFIGQLSGIAFMIIGVIQMISQRGKADLVLKEKIQLRFPSLADIARYLGLRIVFGLVIGLLLGFLSIYLGLFSEIENVLVNSLSKTRSYILVDRGWWTPEELARWVSFIIMPAIGTVAGLVVGMHHLIDAITETTSVTERLQPNLGVSLSLHNAFQMTGFYVLGVTPLLVAIISAFLFIFGESQLPFGEFLIILGTLLLLNSTVISIAGWWVNGGQVVFQHYFIRRLLETSNKLPYAFNTRCLVEYLNAMSDRFLLRRVGGGWEFYHKLLHERFAEIGMDDAQQHRD